MRELEVCRELIAQVLEVAEKHGSGQVESVVFQVGTLAGVEPALLADAFPFISAGTPAEGAELIIETLPVRVSCPACGAETEPRSLDRRCGVCGTEKTALVSGDELQLVRVDLAQPETAVTRH